MKNTRSSKLAKHSSKTLISAALVMSSVLAAWLFIESSKTTETFLITKQDMASGSALIASELSTAELSLFGISSQYLKSEEQLRGAYLLRPMASGEVIPLSAITTQFLDDYSNIVITPTIALSSRIRPGSLVSIWSAAHLDYQSFGEPVLLALDVEVVEVLEAQSNFQAANKSVELRVPLLNIQSLIRALSNGDALALTKTGESLGR